MSLIIDVLCRDGTIVGCDSKVAFKNSIIYENIFASLFYI